MGIRAYGQLLAGQPTSQDEQLVAQVNRVGQRLAIAADKPQFDWEFRVIAGEEMHACALPGGKVVISEGLLHACQDEAGLAVVLSHAMAHALARHGSERISPPAAPPGLRGALQTLVRPPALTVTPQEITQAYGADPHSAEPLPYSRKHEIEADAIGLILMAKAGYDPSAAPEFWERLSRRSDGSRSRWIATHPAGAYRITELRSMLPVAMNYYDAAPQQLGLGEALPVSNRSEASLADAAPPPHKPAPREQNADRGTRTSAVPHRRSSAVTPGTSPDTSQNAPHEGTEAASSGATEIARVPESGWVSGTKSPPKRITPAPPGVARVWSDDAPPAWDVSQGEADAGAPSAQPPATTPPADDDIFYPPIAISRGAPRIPAPVPPPSRH